MRLLTVICVAAIVVAFAVPALAETQNIKVSGDIKVAHIYQQDIDFDDSDVSDDADNQNFFLQQVGLNVEADLTDNVSTYVRLIQERPWGDNLCVSSKDTEAFDVSLDEAYVTLKEMLYAPLTLKIGRQNIWLGKGLMVGNAGLIAWDQQTNLPATADEMSDMTAFDAIRATLDYDPWTIDLIYSKIDENSNTTATPDNYDDIDLYVANIGYDFTKYDAEAEVYYICKWDRTNTSASDYDDSDDIHTVGLRGSLVPFDNMDVWAEGAFQFGNYKQTAAIVARDREAYALNVGGDYTFTDVRWTPLLGVEYTYLSGENQANTGDWTAWEPLYPGKFNTQILAFREITKLTAQDGTNPMTNNNSGATNLKELGVFAGINPMTDITVDGRLSFQWFDEVPRSGLSEDIGMELDGQLTYDYTEDVQFTVAAGMVWPGDYYTNGMDDTASQIVSAVSVDF